MKDPIDDPPAPILHFGHYNVVGRCRDFENVYILYLAGRKRCAGTNRYVWRSRRSEAAERYRCIKNRDGNFVGFVDG